MAKPSSEMENLVDASSSLSVYRNKKIFVTGHTGFKGAWLVSCLHLLGAEIKGYALPPDYENGLYDLIKPLQLVNSVLADIRDRKKLEKEIISFQPDFIFHLAAQPLVRRSYEIPAETFEVNVGGTANLLEAVMHLEKKCTVVVVTTDKVYENREENILYKEDDRLGGYDPYSASKACAELVVASFRNSFFHSSRTGEHQKAVATARAGNVIGGGDWSRDRIVPDIVRSLQAEKEIDVRNPNAVRPWQHVLEPIAGYLLLGALLQKQPGKYSTAFNFGPLPDDHLKVCELVAQAIKTWGAGTWKDCSDRSQPHEAGLLKLDVSRAMNELNWKPKLDAAGAIGLTMNWYRQPVSSQPGFTFQQIKSYFAL